MPSSLGRLLHFGRAPLGQRSAGHSPVADVAVGDRDELDVMAQRGPLGRHAAGLELAVVRMRAKADDPQLAVVLGPSQTDTFRQTSRRESVRR